MDRVSCPVNVSVKKENDFRGKTDTDNGHEQLRIEFEGAFYHITSRGNQMDSVYNNHKLYNKNTAIQKYKMTI